MSVATHQQKCYELAYSGLADSSGFPDPKITDGIPVENQRILTAAADR